LRLERDWVIYPPNVYWKRDSLVEIEQNELPPTKNDGMIVHANCTTLCVRFLYITETLFPLSAFFLKLIPCSVWKGWLLVSISRDYETLTMCRLSTRAWLAITLTNAKRRERIAPIL
jgi:hypothetical protein